MALILPTSQGARAPRTSSRPGDRCRDSGGTSPLPAVFDSEAPGASLHEPLPVVGDHPDGVPAGREPTRLVGQPIGWRVVDETLLEPPIDVQLYLGLRQLRLVVAHRRAYDGRAVADRGARLHAQDNGSRVRPEGFCGVQASAGDQLATQAGYLVHGSQDAGFDLLVAPLGLLALDESSGAGDVRRRHRGALSVAVLVVRERAQYPLAWGREIHGLFAVVGEARKLVLVVAGSDSDDVWIFVAGGVDRAVVSGVGEVGSIDVVADITGASVHRSGDDQMPLSVCPPDGVSQGLSVELTALEVVETVAVVAYLDAFGH